MKKSIYTIYINCKLRNKYVTTTRNAEDMINQILQFYNTEVNPIKIYRQTEGEKKVLIHTENYKTL